MTQEKFDPAALLAEWTRVHEAATAGTWNVWDGPLYLGGGADLCIGAGKTWLFNMDHRSTLHMSEIGTAEHPWSHPDDCPICSVSGAEVTREQRANADAIAHYHNTYGALLEVARGIVEELAACREVERNERVSLRSRADAQLNAVTLDELVEPLARLAAGGGSTDGE